MSTYQYQQESEVRVHSSTQGFTIIKNGIFRDRDLSLKAKALLCTMLSLPPDWDLSIKGLYKIINPVGEDGKTRTVTGQGRDGIRSMLNELESRGYLIRSQVRNESGVYERMVYHVFDVRQNTRSQPMTGSPTPVEPTSGEPPSADAAPNKGLSPSKENLPSIHPKEAPTEGEASANETGEGKTDGEEDGLRGAFMRLCDRSLKSVWGNEIDMTFEAYRKRIEEGNAPEEIARAYEHYAKRYFADDSHTNTKYALRLYVWLQRADGFERDKAMMARDAASAGAACAASVPQPAREPSDESIRSWLVQNDPAYAEAQAEHASAGDELARYPLDHGGFTDEVVAFVADAENPLNQRIRKAQKTMDEIFLARKDEATAALDKKAA